MAHMLEPGRLRLETYPVPEPEPGAVVAEVARANVCGSELHIWRDITPERENPRLALLGILPTMVDARTTLAAEVLQEIRRYYAARGIRVFETVIPRSVRFAAAPAYYYRRPAVWVDPQARWCGPTCNSSRRCLALAIARWAASSLGGLLDRWTWTASHTGIQHPSTPESRQEGDL